MSFYNPNIQSEYQYTDSIVNIKNILATRFEIRYTELLPEIDDKIVFTTSNSILLNKFQRKNLTIISDDFSEILLDFFTQVYRLKAKSFNEYIEFICGNNSISETRLKVELIDKFKDFIELLLFTNFSSDYVTYDDVNYALLGGIEIRINDHPIMYSLIDRLKLYDLLMNTLKVTHIKSRKERQSNKFILEFLLHV